MVYTQLFYRPFFMHVICICNIIYFLVNIEIISFWQWYFIKLFPFIDIFVRIAPCLNEKINLLILLLENLDVFLNSFFSSSSVLFHYFLLQDKHLYFMKLSLTLSCSRKQSQSLHLILQIHSVGLSTRFDNELAINLALSNLFLQM